MRLILHTGWSRTGTTAVQIKLADNAEGLLNHGVLLPKAGRNPFGAHHELASAVRNWSDSQLLGNLLDQLDQEFQSCTFHTVILTSELFPFVFNSTQFAEWTKKWFDEVQVLCVLRPQSSWLLSAYSQHANTVVNLPPMRLFEFALRYWDALDIDTAITTWRKTPFISEVRALKYSRDIVIDFFGAIGCAEILAEAALDNVEVNASIDQSLLLVISTLREALANNQDRVNSAIGFLNNYERSAGILERTILFSSDEQLALDALFQKGNERVGIENFSDIKALQVDCYRDILCIKSLPPALLGVLCQL
jgi:hypothetical protein